MSDTRQFLEALGIKLNRYAEGAHKSLCPKCSARRSLAHQKEPCLYVKVTDEGFGFRCYNCGWSGGEKLVAQVDAKATSPTETRDINRQAALPLWGEAKVSSLPYLDQRGITIAVPLTLRRHGALLHKATGLYLPGMVAAVQSASREVVAIHRTFLTSDWKRKAPVSDSKMALGSLGTGSVRLGPAGEELGIAEGIETGLSAMQLFGISVWCSLGTERLHKIELPPEVKRVVIFADNGAAGRKAAMKAVETYTVKGRKVTLRFPPEKFGDFNDLLMSQKVAA